MKRSDNWLRNSFTVFAEIVQVQEPASAPSFQIPPFEELSTTRLPGSRAAKNSRNVFRRSEKACVSRGRQSNLVSHNWGLKREGSTSTSAPVNPSAAALALAAGVVKPSDLGKARRLAS